MDFSFERLIIFDHLIGSISNRTKSFGGRFLDSDLHSSMAVGMILLPSRNFVS